MLILIWRITSEICAEPAENLHATNRVLWRNEQAAGVAGGEGLRAIAERLVAIHGRGALVHVLVRGDVQVHSVRHE